MIARFSNITQANTLKINNNKKFKNKENSNQNNSSTPSFKGAVDTAVSAGTAFLNFLNVNPAIGACFVDLGFMVTPRTIVDAGRSVNAGLETGIREATGTTNHATVGLDGALAAYLVSYGFNKANGVSTHKMFMDSDTIDILENIVKTSETPNGYDAEKYWKSFFSDIKGLNSTKVSNAQGAEREVWQNLSQETIDTASRIMAETGSTDYNVPDSKLEKVYELVVKDIEAGENFKIERAVGESSTVATGSIRNLISNANEMLKAVQDKAKNDGAKIVQDLPEFLKGIKNKKLATVLAGMSIPVAVGIAAQPLNRYYTKKRTGEDGFVGVKGRKPDHSTEFKVLKTVAALGLGSGMIATILKNPKMLYTNPVASFKEILSKLQFKGKIPTINQFKFIYGMTIMSRLLAARDKNELREGTIKDTLGFFNWLILGGFVSKVALNVFRKTGLVEENLVNYDKKVNGNGWFSKLTKSAEKSHEEILYPALKKAGISVVDEQGNVMGFGKLMRKLKEVAKSPETSAEIKNAAQKAIKHVHYKNAAQVLGYIYSGLVLGVGIPKLNIAITKYYDGKQNVEETETSKMKVPEMNIKPDSKTFSAFGAYLQ